MYKAYKMAAPSSKACKYELQLQIVSAGVSRTVPSSAAKLAHLSLNYSIQFYWTLCALYLPLVQSVMFWTYDHEAILYTGLRFHPKLFHCGIGRQEVLLMCQEAKEYPSFSLGNRLYIRLGLYSRSRGKTFHTPSEEKEDYSACVPRKAEQTHLCLWSLLLDTNKAFRGLS